MRVYLSGGNPTHDMVLEAFAEGAGATLVSGWKWAPDDIAVVFGIRKERVPASYPRGEIIKKQERHGGRVIVLETGYVNRGSGRDHHYAAGWGGLNGRADFRNAGMAADRWELLGRGLRPWRGDGARIVVCGQVPWDAACQDHHHLGWCQLVTAKLGRRFGPAVAFRPHPLAAGVNYGVRCEISARTLDEDLADAKVVVTWNSNTAVDAVIAGVPVIAMDPGSMAWAVAGHTLDDVENPPKPDREKWTWALAHCQWLPAEMSAGLAWRHLSRP